ncbi:PL29 family lyase N-terminal domain-containing protein [uncultured Bacteroides sp.]|uniref:PL29 family lyase N-terminal domain-containing protein n=1 Tax=uncultured Bacteroides sp. TaxID=162156 RepID=UPI0025DED964|nr:PL29 family lyase N-terminal domain-containing protein [uncultured Bacteroides sp.]
MKIKTILCAVFAATLMGSCNYDDGELWDAVNGQEERISALEKWQKTVVEQLNSLQGILTATDYITDVEKISKDGKEGYKISFLHAAPITLYYNEDKEVSGTGENVVGVAQEEGTGKWYWTLDGEALKVDGKTVYVNGGDDIKVEVNADGSTKLTIGDNEVTVPGPITHPVTGVAESGNVVTVTLDGGTTIELPKYVKLEQYLDDSYIGQSQTVDYVLAYPDGYIIKVLDELPDGWKIEFQGKTMSVTYPEAGQIAVTFLISDGQTQTIMKSVKFDASKKADIVWTTINYTGVALTAADLGGAKNIKVKGDTGSGAAGALNNILNVLKDPANGIVNIDLSEVVHNKPLPANAFKYSDKVNNTTIESIILPVTITEIWGSVFVNCTALKNVTIGTNNTIANANTATWFTNCTSLESIFVPADKVAGYKTSWGEKDASLVDKIKAIPAE